MIRADQLCWTWADGVVALGGVDLHLLRGERVLLTGPSGCGKSTLARLIGGLLQHHGLGEVAGSLTVEGRDPSSWTGRERARMLGLVFQDPGDQLVAGTVADEIAFGPRSSGVAFDVAGALGSVGLDLHGSRSPHALSGGQQQRLAVAAGLAAGARIAVLDEPLAHLDPEAAEALLVHLDGLAASGTTVLVIEHRVEACLDWADRVVVLREGRVAYEGAAPPAELLRGEGLQVPALLQVDAVGGLEVLGPVTPVVHASGAVLAQLDSAAVLRGGRCVLQPLELVLHEGERLAVLGPNGAGKSTLLHALAGLSGAVWVPQDPDLSLFFSTVADELAYGPREWGRPKTVQPEHFGLEELMACSPHALSRGQRLRVAVASAVSIGPRILLLDEPTAGQHADAVEATMHAAVTAVTAGEQGCGAMVFATHDLALALRWATRVIVLSAGEVVAGGAPQGAVGHLPLPPLQRAQAARGWPLASLSQQLESNGAGSVRSREWVRVTARSEPEAPLLRRDGSAYGPLLAVATVGTLAVLLDRPISLGVLAAVCVVALMSRALEVRTRFRLGLAMAAVVWSTVLSQGLFYGDLPRTAWVTVGPVTLWREGIGWGLVQSSRLIAVSSAGLAVALTLGPDRLLGALRGLGMPPGLAFLAVTALRFVPVVAREWLVVRRARARRGRPLWRRGPLGWILAEVTMLRPLVVRALRRARRLAESLDSRGFDPTQTREAPPRWTVGDRMIALCCGLGLAAVISAQATYGLYLAEIYHHPALRPLYAWVRAWL